MTDSADKSDSLSVHINADARQVWVMLREPKKVAQWHGWELEELDDEIRQIYFTEAVEDQDHRSVTLRGGDTFSLEPVDDGTQVTITRSTPPEGSLLHTWYAEITAGWRIYLNQLRFALERHPNTPRRTLFFSGPPHSPGSIIDKLGLAGLPEPGEPYMARLSTGAELSGKVWFRAPGQLGLTVSSYAEHGDGLLVLSDTGAVPGQREEPGGMVIVSTYGLGARDLGAIRDGWEKWRASNYPAADTLA